MLGLQDFLILAAPSQNVAALPVQQLTWLFSFDARDPNYKNVGVRKVIRAFLPAELLMEGCSFAWEITSPEGLPLLDGAVKAGVFLHNDIVKMLCAALGVDMPTRGAGKHGGVVKQDLALALASFLFPGETAQELARMAAAMTWQGNAKQKLGDESLRVLELVKELDEENRECPEFKKVAKLAKDTLSEVQRTTTEKSVREKINQEKKQEQERQQEQRQQPQQQEAASASKPPQNDPRPQPDATNPALAEAVAAAVEPRPEALPAATAAKSAPAVAPRRPTQTPTSLRDALLKPDMTMVGINRDPSSYGYRATYPSHGLSD